MWKLLLATSFILGCGGVASAGQLTCDGYFTARDAARQPYQVVMLDALHRSFGQSVPKPVMSELLTEVGVRCFTGHGDFQTIVNQIAADLLAHARRPANFPRYDVATYCQAKAAVSYNGREGCVSTQYGFRTGAARMWDATPEAGKAECAQVAGSYDSLFACLESFSVR